MKISIRRHGIVIKSVEVTGEKARIGSGEECEIRLDDPYLSAHVGNLVRNGAGWRIVDPATSMEGITRDGQRIDEEPVAFGAVYSVGGFELVAEGQGPAAAPGGEAPVYPKTVFETPMPAAGTTPKTVFEAPVPASESGVPRTVFETPLPKGSHPAPVPRTVFEAPLPKSAAPPAGHDLQLHPAPVHPQSSAPVPAPAAPARKKRLILIAGLAAVLLILLLVVATRKGGGAKPESAAATTTAATQTQTTAAARPSKPLPTAEALAADLKVDEAMLAWQLRLEKAPDPALQQKYAAAALEIGMVHAAAGDTKSARSYFERAVRFGPAGSAAVEAARQHLETMR